MEFGSAVACDCIRAKTFADGLRFAVVKFRHE